MIGLGGVAEDALAGEDLSTGFVGGPQGGEWHQDDLELFFTHKYFRAFTFLPTPINRFNPARIGGGLHTTWRRVP
ncbi:hypothetical protein LRB11_17190, partial [Ectothiorhodospira haloalkaliphila]|uniref:hypothetical protein n=1 Tax=Ectothiorhodospira haloalkaliphila TaxID=421628 RepID=UPI001EE7EC5A